MEKISFKCLKCVQPIGEFYLGIMDSEDLVRITYADIRRLETGGEKREVEVYTGIQRELSTSRAKEISKYVNMVDATFPTSVILHLEPSKIISYDEESGIMTIPDQDSVAKVLDGQHRIAGLENYNSSKGFQVAVTIFIGMELEDQAIVFATINKTQTKVNKSLVQDLFEFATHRSPQKAAHNITRALNQKDGSPFKDKIKILGPAQDKEKETITQATFSEALMKLYSKDVMTDRDLYKRGRVPESYSGNDLKNRPLRNLFIEEDDVKIARIFWEYFAAVQNRWPVSWNEVRAEMILNKSTGFLALVRLFVDLYNRLGNPGDLVTADQYKVYFDKSTFRDADFIRTTFLPGSGGQSKLYNELKEQMGL